MKMMKTLFKCSKAFLLILVFILSEILFAQNFTITQLTDDKTADAWAEMEIDDNGKIHITWVKGKIDSTTGNFILSVYYTNNIEGDFAAPKKVSDEYLMISEPTIAVTNNGVAHIIWGAPISGVENNELFYTNNEDGTFSTPIQITTNTKSSGSPHIAIDSNGIMHALWLLHGVQYMKYMNNSGGTFSEPITILEDVRNPQFVLDNQNNIHAVAVKSTNDGNVLNFNVVYVNNIHGTFSEEVLLPQPPNFQEVDIYHPMIAIDSNQKFHVIWKYSSQDQKEGVYYSNNINGEFSFPSAIVDNLADILHASLVDDSNNNIHIAYATEGDIFYTNNIAGSFISSVAVTDDTTTEAIMRSNQRNIVFNEIENTVSILYFRQPAEDIATIELMLATASIIAEVDIEGSQIVQEFNLSQNYPNPFNPNTSIEFSLPSSGYVSLKIYSLLGEEITSLLTEILPSGNHNVSFDGQNLNSGIYFYQLNFDGVSLRKKMILLK